MRFEKVSFNQYSKDYLEDFGQNSELLEYAHEMISTPVEEIYEGIKLPKRATYKSAGYDIFAPYDFSLKPGSTIRIATGIKVLLDDDKTLIIAPRSGHGFKARIQLDNTIGVIDADYSESSNEGHIMMKLTNDSHTGKIIKVAAGEAMAQGLIIQYFKVDDDNVDNKRNGGFGSTSKKEDN